MVGWVGSSSLPPGGKERDLSAQKGIKGTEQPFLLCQLQIKVAGLVIVANSSRKGLGGTELLPAGTSTWKPKEQS